MPGTEPDKDVNKEQPPAVDNIESQELGDDDLKTVSGGISSGGASLSETPVCVSIA
jgi:hypothetical protein